VPVLPGDVIVAGSDGLFDNTFDADVIATCAGTNNEVGAAIALAKLARERASDPLFESPYTREALKQGFDIPWDKKLAGARFVNGKVELAKLTGGKQDDITVLVARVAEEEEGEQ
jgi:protein phosphatase PTC7